VIQIQFKIFRDSGMDISKCDVTVFCRKIGPENYYASRGKIASALQKIIASLALLSILS